MLKDDKRLLDSIKEAIQEKKGYDIVIADFSKMHNVEYKYFVICQGNTAIQVEAIAHEIGDYVREHSDEKPMAVSGMENAIWIAMDYGRVIVHIFQPEARAFYDLEHLWEDAKLTQIPNEYWMNRDNALLTNETD